MLIYPRSNGVSKAVAGESSLANITCDGKKIPLVSNTRLLGVIVDSNLSWKDHVDQVCLKVNRKIGALRLSFRQLTPTARQAFFLSVIQPDLKYAASAIVPLKHGSFTKESSPSNLAKGSSVCSRKWLSGQCGTCTPCKTVKVTIPAWRRVVAPRWCCLWARLDQNFSCRFV